MMHTDPEEAEVLETLTRLRAEFDSWHFRHRSGIAIPWRAQRRHEMRWNGGIHTLTARDAKMPREWLLEVAILDGWRTRRS
ncbi:hypothetical protein [Actinomadura rubrisoli]|uniref:Uncharacterized protein n=1 Tax=Actinomadura rubrisoli TaxID=2530368 RepID=A0A4R5AZT4_9ACTN|nr:hypothetical protein [Actinomadura rubrisoli]TDD76212.1 hypothetical protein E1298_30915 [Actinomadura rubrisoli]